MHTTLIMLFTVIFHITKIEDIKVQTDFSTFSPLFKRNKIPIQTANIYKIVIRTRFYNLQMAFVTPNE